MASTDGGDRVAQVPPPAASAADAVPQAPVAPPDATPAVIESASAPSGPADATLAPETKVNVGIDGDAQVLPVAEPATIAAVVGAAETTTEAAPADVAKLASVAPASAEGVTPHAVDALAAGEAAAMSITVSTADSEISPLLKLLEKPPGEIAAWALHQVRDLEEADIPIESLPIFELASALKTAPVQQKDALISSMMQGLGDLPLKERSEALRLVTSLPSTGVAGNLGGLASGSASSSASGSAEASVSALGAKLAQLAKEAAFDEMPADELQILKQTVENEQGALIQPLLDAVPELSEAERKQITDALVEKGLVTEQHRAMLEETIKPGGHADQLAYVMKWANRTYQYAAVVWLSPLMDITIMVLQLLATECKLPLLLWLNIDATIAVCIAVLAYAIKQKMMAPYKEFTDNPLKMVNRVQASLAEGAKVTDAIPGSGPAIYMTGAVVVMIVTGAIWAVYGVVELVASTAAACTPAERFPTIAVCGVIIFVRIMLPVALVNIGLKFRRKLRELKQDSSEPLLSSAEAANYGTHEGLAAV